MHTKWLTPRKMEDASRLSHTGYSTSSCKMASNRSSSESASNGGCMQQPKYQRKVSMCGAVTKWSCLERPLKVFWNNTQYQDLCFNSMSTSARITQDLGSDRRQGMQPWQIDAGWLIHCWPLHSDNNSNNCSPSLLWALQAHSLTCPHIISYIRTPRAHQSTVKP